jgi:hypothetical protein
MPKSETGEELKRFLEEKIPSYKKEYMINGLVSWIVDFYIPGSDPVVIEVKGAKSKASIGVLAKEAFTLFHDLIHNSTLSKNTKYVLIIDRMPLRNPTQDFHKLIEKLGVTILSIDEKEKLLSIVGH